MGIRVDHISQAFSGQQVGKSAYEETKVEHFKDKLAEAAKQKDDEGLREAAREFESYFIGMMLKQMRRTVVESELTVKSEARKQFETMLDDEYAKSMASGEGIGLGAVIFDAMKQAYGL